jgi:hypothetical protein
MWREVRLHYDWWSVGQSVCLGIEHPCGTCDQILLPVGMLLSEICDLVSAGRPLWREDRSVICSVITQWSESRRTRNHTLLSHLRLPQPGGPVSHIYIPQEQGGSVIPPGHWVRINPLKFYYPLTSSSYLTGNTSRLRYNSHNTSVEQRQLNVRQWTIYNKAARRRQHNLKTYCTTVS